MSTSIVELETDQIQDTGTNDVVGVAQNLGALAATLGGGDENLRLGFSLDGTIAAPQDLDVYSFSATAGTPVWIDIDHTHGSLDSVVELLDASGRIVAQSNNSLAESAGTESRFISTTVPSPLTPDSVAGLDRDVFAPANSFTAQCRSRLVFSQSARCGPARRLARCGWVQPIPTMSASAVAI